MRNTITLTVVVVLSMATVQAQNLTQSSVEQAQEIIDKAVAAYGGAERLRALNEVEIISKSITYSVNQSKRPGPPWDKAGFESLTATNIDDEHFFVYNVGDGGGFEFENANLRSREQTKQANFRAGTATEAAPGDYTQTAGPFLRVTPTLMLRELLLRPNTAHYLGAIDIEGGTHDAISLVMRAGPAITLYVDRTSGLISGSDRILPFFGLVEYRFGEYRPVDGVQFNHFFDLRVNGNLSMERTVSRIRTSGDFDNYAAKLQGLEVIEAPDLPPMMFKAIAEDVYLSGGNGTYGLFVDMGEFIVAVGTTGGAAARITALRERMPDKPIRYVLITHHHNDHLAGVPDFVTEGAKLLVADSHVDVVKAAAGAEYADSIVPVSRAWGLKGDTLRFEAHVIGPTKHTEQLLIAYIPEHQLIFEADHFALPAVGSVPPAVSSTASFSKALQKSKLEIKSIASAHSPRVGTTKELRQAVRTKPVNGDPVFAF